MKRANRWNLEPNLAEAFLQTDWRGEWLVLRCPGRKTLQLVTALINVGVTAWTPIWVRQRRYPRSTITHKLLLPCLPTFVFLAEKDASAAVGAANANGVPDFSLMLSNRVLVRIKDKDLENLRKAADLNPHKRNPVQHPKVGTKQRIVSGAFQGLTCSVTGNTAHHCLVEIEGHKFPQLKIPPFLLGNIGE